MDNCSKWDDRKLPNIPIQCLAQWLYLIEVCLCGHDIWKLGFIVFQAYSMHASFRTLTTQFLDHVRTITNGKNTVNQVGGALSKAASPSFYIPYKTIVNMLFWQTMFERQFKQNKNPKWHYLKCVKVNVVGDVNEIQTDQTLTGQINTQIPSDLITSKQSTCIHRQLCVWQRISGIQPYVILRWILWNGSRNLDWSFARRSLFNVNKWWAIFVE